MLDRCRQSTSRIGELLLRTRDLDQIRPGGGAGQLLDRAVEALPEILGAPAARSWSQLVRLLHARGVGRPGVARCGRRATDLGFLACDGRQVREATTEPGVGRRHAVCLDRSAPALLGGREQLLDWVQFGAHDGEA